MLAAIVGIVAYVLGALGFYSIASRRGINHAWLAWVPIGNMWLLGCISDQYQSVVHHKTKRKRISLLVMNILIAICVVALIVMVLSMVFQIFAMMTDEMGNTLDIYEDEEAFTEAFSAKLEQEMSSALAGVVLKLGVCYLALIALGIPMLIVQLIALRDVFRSCDPGSSTLYLLLSIFLGISGFLVFACRDKDYGMPARQTQQPAYMPYQPGQGVYNYGGSNICPQPPVQSQEPWEKQE